MTVSKAVARVQELVPLLFVTDIARSAAFYEQLGFSISRRWEAEDGTLGWCRLDRDGAALMLQQATEEDEPLENRGRGVGFYFICDDVDALHAELTSRGMSIAAPTVMFYGMKQIFPQDPDGYVLCFQSPTR